MFEHVYDRNAKETYNSLSKSKYIFFYKGKYCYKIILEDELKYYFGGGISNEFHYSTVKEISLQFNEFPIYLKYRLYEIYIEILNSDEFIKKSIKTNNGMPYDELSKIVPINDLPLCIFNYIKNNNKIIGYKSINENHPYYIYKNSGCLIFMIKKKILLKNTPNQL